MSFPGNLDIAIQALLEQAVSGTDYDHKVSVCKSVFVPAADEIASPNGYIYFDIDEIIPQHSSEGLSEERGLEVVTFNLDVACASPDNGKRKKLCRSVLDTLQPRSHNRRVQLTSQPVRSSGVFINYCRLNSQNEVASIKTGHSAPDVLILVLSFSGKATLES